MTTTHGHGKPAPVADWVTIEELYRDPFPTFERLRAEGGVHWIPAIGRYLITSYDAVHDTELDQETFSANEEGSLMIRAMGHSMLRKDDPEHRVERQAWQPVMRPSVVKKTWAPIFERNAQRYLNELKAKGPGADLVWDFAAPYAGENLRAVTGLHNVTQQDLQRWSQTMIDATGNYADDPVVWAKGEASYNEVDEALDEMLAWHKIHQDDSMLSALVRLPDYQMPVESIRANLKMTIGGGLNEPRDAIGVAAWALMQNPDQLAMVQADPALWDAVFDEAIRWVAPIGMYSRQTTRDVVLQGTFLPAGAKLGISLLSANRDENYWKSPERFDLTRTGEGAHLAFGKGVHVCLGAWVARAQFAAALPKLFSELPNLGLIPDRPAEAGGWVFRGMDLLPVRWDAEVSAVESEMQPAHVAIVGSGPAGCYTAQAITRRLPDARVTVFDKSPTPFGLVRSGVAADHQGTKDVEVQFSQLFERHGVEFIGSTTVTTGQPLDDVAIHGRPSFHAPKVSTMHSDGAEITLQQLRDTHDVVVVATGLSADNTLAIDGADAPQVYGAGQLARLLNADAQQHRTTTQLPTLGTTTTVVGNGNVAMDMIRLLASTAEQLAATDIDEPTHAALTEHLHAINVIGRSDVTAAKFDTVMLREIADLPGITHTVTGFDPEAAPHDARAKLVAELAARPADPAARMKINWYFGHTPDEVVTTDGKVEALMMSSTTTTYKIATTSVITAIGFHGDQTEQLLQVSDEARSTGRITEGLYAAGWLRRGPVGTIPSQRTDARELAEVIATDLAAPRIKQVAGLPALRHHLARSTTWDGWLMIDAYEKSNTTDLRPRTKLTDTQKRRFIAASATALPRAQQPQHEVELNNEHLPPLTIAYATESGNAELVSEELVRALADRANATAVDMSTMQPGDFQTDTPMLVITSSYDEGELPTGIRDLYAQLLAEGTDLTSLYYALFGLGDSSYEFFAKGATLVDAAFQELGARRVGEIGRHDAGGGTLATDETIAWVTTVIEELVQADAADVVVAS
ncbi:cytochrome P450 [Enteractinococcus coprophilus]|uniref:Cytochrome P450 n=1 Tax=Enteractinococcus coprophilus TaxID=1027633 RepID=A0A543AG13_9MICC|nr:cytochrome P450 [Enteractinococcus coprophilus]TQL71524.1 cytochrome P450 [Enteractinococcus coprophilus]